MRMLPLLAVVAVVAAGDDCEVKPACASLDACSVLMRKQRTEANYSGGLDDEAQGLSAGFESIKPPPIDALVGFLDSNDQRQRDIAAHALGRLRSKRAVPALLRHLDDTGWASWALGGIGDPAAIPALLERLDPGRGEAEALQRLGRPAALALAGIVVDRSATDGRRSSAAFALADFPEDGAHAAIPMVRDALRAKDPRTTELVLMILHGLGPVAGAAIPEVRALRDAASGSAKMEIEQTLVRLGDPSLAAEYARRMWTDPIVTHMALADLGPAASSAVPELIRVLQSGPWPIREDAAHALGLIRDARAVDALVMALDVRSWKLNHEAARALGRVGPDAARVSPRLRELESKHWSAVVRDSASVALRRINGEHVPESRPWPDVTQVVQDHRDEGMQPHGVSCRSEHAVAPGVIQLNPLSGARWREGWVTIDASWAPQSAFRNPIPTTTTLPLAKIPGREIVVEVANGWLVGRDAGEWGGEALSVGTSGAVERIIEGNVFGFAQVGDALFVLTGLAHMGSDDGTVQELSFRDGHWRATPLVALPGAPMGFKVTDGNILVVTMQDVAAIGVDGSVRLLPCR